MNLSSATVTTALLARAVPVSAALPVAGKRLTATATIGGTDTRSYPAADIAYAVEIVADAGADIGTLSLEDGTCVATLGSPVCVGSGFDFNAVALPTAVKIYAIRITGGVTNAGICSVDQVLGGCSFSNFSLNAGQVILLHAQAGSDFGIEGGDTIEVTFAAADDSILIEVLAGTV